MVSKDLVPDSVQHSIVRSNHVVRVTVLGLAGITVDRKKCRDHLMMKSAPPPPTQMKSLVAFSRNSTIKGITSQSKSLTRSPSDDIVVAQQGRIQNNETASETVGASDQLQRHVAVWASDGGTIGSVVTFEAKLQSIAQQQFAPMAFDLMIALAEDNEMQHKIALPFGIATLIISGDECKSGRSVQVDLPVLSLAAARPLSNIKVPTVKKDGLNGYPMIAISPLPKDSSTKRSALQRLFRRDKSPKVPNEAVRHAFASTYSVDANGDAILRVSLQVYEKGSALEKSFCLRGDSSVTSSLNISPKPESCHESIASDHNETLEVNDNSTRDDDDDDDSLFPKDEESTSQDKSYNASHDDSCDDTNEGTNQGTYEGTHVDDQEVQSIGSGTYATNEDAFGFFAWDDARPRVDDDDDSYTLSFEKKEDANSRDIEDVDDIDPIEIDFFGRKIPIPMCLPIGDQHNDENDSFVSRKTKGRLNQLVNDFRDDLTLVTADIFGRSFSIPVCTAAKAMGEDDDDDDDDFTMSSDRDTQGASVRDNISWTDKVRRASQSCTGLYLDQSQVRENSHKDAAASKARRAMLQTLSENVIDATVHNENETVNRTPLPLSPTSAEEWLLSTQLPVNKGQSSRQQKKADYSPRGVHDLPHARSTPTRLSSPLGKTFSDFFGFSSSDDPHQKHQPLRKQYHGDRDEAASASVKHERSRTYVVPPVVTPDEVASVGDLTATTHERNIASEMNILDRYRRKIEDQERRSKTKRSGSDGGLLIPVPIAFGGSGMCLGSSMPESSPSTPQARSNGSSIVVAMDGEKEKLVKGIPTPTTNENYFAEYDDYSIAAPTAVRRGRDPPPTMVDDPSDMAFNPIEMTISGYHNA